MGKDPIEARKDQALIEALEEAKAVAFEDCAKDYISAHRSGWKNAKHGDRWTATLKTWAYPIIGKLCQLAPLPLIW